MKCSYPQQTLNIFYGMSICTAKLTGKTWNVNTHSKLHSQTRNTNNNPHHQTTKYIHSKSHNQNISCTRQTPQPNRGTFLPRVNPTAKPRNIFYPQPSLQPFYQISVTPANSSATLRDNANRRKSFSQSMQYSYIPPLEAKPRNPYVYTGHPKDSPSHSSIHVHSRFKNCPLIMSGECGLVCLLPESYGQIFPIQVWKLKIRIRVVFMDIAVIWGRCTMIFLGAKLSKKFPAFTGLKSHMDTSWLYFEIPINTP